MGKKEYINSISINAIGDIGLMGEVDRTLRNNTEFPFIHCAEVLKNADIVFGNLEIPFLVSKNVKHINSK